jgi:hypothetical protein
VALLALEADDELSGLNVPYADTFVEGSGRDKSVVG